MPVIRGIGVRLVIVTMLTAVAACGPALANEAPPAAGSQALSTVSGTSTLQPSEAVIWGRVPYCNCLAASATDNVANALEKANLTVRLKEQSPHDGWLYFVVAFDPHSATPDSVGAAMMAGGAELLAGPP